MTTPSSFISWVGHGAASLAPAGVFTNANAHFFVFKAAGAAMQNVADTFLNSVAAGKVHYRTFTDRALVTFMDIERCTSDTDRVGWVPGRECALWIPLLEHDPGQLLPRFVLWAPYIYISYTIGMLTGRETWGWPKVSADIAVANDAPGAPSAFACSTMMFNPMHPDTQGTLGTLFSVATNSSYQQPRSTWTSGIDAARAIVGDLVGDLAAEVLDALLLRPVIPAVVMKQFRDAADSQLTCYQAIVDSPAEITRFAAGGLLRASDFELTITTCDSHRVAHDFLGVNPTTPSTVLPIEWAAWTQFDFRAPSGRVVAP